MVPALNAIEGVECRSIEGAFYLFPRFPNSTKNSLELADALLEKVGHRRHAGYCFRQQRRRPCPLFHRHGPSELERAVERLATIAHEL